MLVAVVFLLSTFAGSAWFSIPGIMRTEQEVFMEKVRVLILILQQEVWGGEKIVDPSAMQMKPELAN